MANKKNSDLDELTAIANGDNITIRDVSDTTNQVTGETKRSSWTSIKAFLKTYFDGIYADAGANADITSMTGLDDDGIPLAKVDGATGDQDLSGYALKGANADITSLSGLTTALSVAQGGTGVKTLSDGGLVVGNVAGAVEVVTAAATTHILVGGGANTKPIWTEASGTGAPVRATSPTLVTPALGTPASGDLSNCTNAGGMATTSVADEAEIALDTGKTGWGTAMAGVNEEIIKFRFTAAGVVTVISNSANAINTDTDGCLCVYDAGAGIAIKNRLGATKNIRYFINYS